MASSKSVMLVISLVVLGGLTGIAGFTMNFDRNNHSLVNEQTIANTVSQLSLFQIRSLSLPISQIFAFAAVFLPLITFITTQLIHPLLRDKESTARNALWIILLSAFQLIYETIIATLSIVYMIPSCSIEDKWQEMYSNKDANAMRAIQDRFDCCGFNSLVDRPWPFARGRKEEGHGVDQCKITYGRERSCRVPWQQQERVNAALLFGVAAIIFVAKALLIIIKFRRGAWNQTSSWIASFGVLFTGRRQDNYGRVRLIGSGEEEGAVEPYRDDINGGGQGNISNSNDGRPSVQPSGLIGDTSERWREDI
ncbi:hypothetical protein B7463_g6700, partial [Scytalidium lignicola]